MKVEISCFWEKLERGENLERVNIILGCPKESLKLYGFKELVIFSEAVLAALVGVWHFWGLLLLRMVLRAYPEIFKGHCHPP